METIHVKWNEEMSFQTEVNGHKLILDAAANVGGKDAGPRPKPLLLVALGGCTGMDVVSLLKKMRVDIDDFNVAVEADLNEEHPKYYNKIHLKYEIWGKDLPLEKIEKAVNLSQEKYCGVSAMLGKVATMSHEIVTYESR